ncbi:MAG: hypothetical protein KIH08_08475 [Candidatus Freyarchaeota archaeon]|nr:hypothetical protein [Candidatus Jordarchaeia archaeon]MBS7269830.1 hypothetical protein [Candidatus Jordarchaeia archaeon]MBS7278544.1 hypothetical protein [Candidatus Jordarchaeia archaeon]
MVKKFTAFKIVMGLVMVGLVAIPVTALASLTQFQFYPNPMDSLTPASIDENGTITKTSVIYVTNFGWYDVNSILIATSVLNESFYFYSEPLIRASVIPKGSIMPILITMSVNTTALNATGALGDFLNTSSFFGQTILSVRYAFALATLSTLLINPIGGMSPMFNLTIGPAILDLVTNTTANVTIFFLNTLQSYNLNVKAELRNSSGLVASGTGSFTIPSAAFFAVPFIENITISTGGVSIVPGGGYTLIFTVESPFGYTYTESGYEVVPT